MEPEAKAIETAFQAQLVNLWAKLFDAFSTSNGNEHAELAASERFRAGVILARRVRDLALKQLG